MEMRTLGRTGVTVSPLCLDAMMFGAWGNPDREDPTRSSTRHRTRGSTSSTPPTSTRRGSRRNSLRRLQTDHIDLHRIHRPAPDTDVEETLDALTDLQRAGKIGHFGSSTFPASQVVQAQWAAEKRHSGRFVTEQPPYSLLVRGIEREVLPVCQQYGMVTSVWSPDEVLDAFDAIVPPGRT